MRIAILSLIFALSWASEGLAQSPTDGQVNAQAYVNSYFRISYARPSILRPVDTASLNLHPSSPNGNEFLLFSARQGDEPYGVIVLAEKLKISIPQSNGIKVPLPRTNAIKDAADFMARVKWELDSAGEWRKIKEAHFTNADGFPIDEMDYEIKSEYASAIVVQVGHFLIAFKCNAKSASDLSEMTKSVVALHRLK